MKLSHRIALSSFLLVPIMFAFRVAAYDSTPSAVSSPSPEEITANLKERLIETINGTNEVDADSGHTGYVGRVRDIVQDTIVMEDKSGKKNVLVSDDTNIIRSPGNASIKLANVRIDDGIIAIGQTISEGDELQSARIIVSDNPFTSTSKTSGVAEITKIGKSVINLSAINTSSPVALTINSKTNYKNIKKILSYDDLSVGDTVIYSASVDPKDPTDLTATVIMQIKTGKPIASPLDSPLPSVKASPKVSPKSTPLASPGI